MLALATSPTIVADASLTPHIFHADSLMPARLSIAEVIQLPPGTKWSASPWHQAGTQLAINKTQNKSYLDGSDEILDGREVSKSNWVALIYMNGGCGSDWIKSVTKQCFLWSITVSPLVRGAVSTYRNNTYEYLKTKAWGKAAGALLWWE